MKNIFVLLLFSANAFAQKQTSADSLLQLLSSSSADSVKAGLYNKISTVFFNSNPELALQYANTGIAFAAAKNQTAYLPELYFSAANAYNATGNDDSARFFCTQCITAAGVSGKTSLQANALRTLGYIYMNQSNYNEASAALFKGLKIAETAKDEAQIASLHSTISTMYMHQSNFDKAIFYGEQALTYFKKINAPQKLGTVYMNVGLIYAEIKNDSRAKLYYENALAEFKKINYKLGLATVYGNLSNIMMNDAAKKIEYLLAAQKIWDEIAPDHPNAAGNIGNLGVAYLSLVTDTDLNSLPSGSNIPKNKSVLLQKAEVYLTRAVQMCRQIDFGRDLVFFTEQLAKLQEVKGDYKLAAQYLRDYIKLNDSLYSQENKNNIAEAEGKHEIDKKNAELAINKLTIANQQKIRIGLTAGILFLVLIGGLLYRQSITRKKNNITLLQLNSELDEANKVKAKFFGILSHDLRSPVANLISFLQLQKRNPGLLSEQQLADREQKISTAAATLLENMEGMLLWSKGQMENFKPEQTAVQVCDLFTYLQKFFAGSENIDFSFDDTKKLIIHTDENYLRTIMQNLTANAIKALQQTPAAAIKWKAWEENGHILLSITDNGPGMSAEKAKTLFDETAISGSRHGLGLHIIRDLAKAINCQLRFTPETGSGTTFILTL